MPDVTVTSISKDREIGPANGCETVRPVTPWTTRIFHANRAYIARYLIIGALAASVDLGTFQTLLIHGLYRPFATTVSYFVAICVHFTLNKMWTFKSYQRPVVHQLATYACVLSVSLLITQIVIESLVRGFNVDPLLAKACAIAVQIPVSFFGHRYMTFHLGALAALRVLRLHGDQPPA